jgi:hypothetical protein
MLVAQAIFVSPASGGDASAQARGKTNPEQSRTAHATTHRETQQLKTLASSEQAALGQTSNRTLQLRVVNSKTGRPEPKVSIRFLIGGRFAFAETRPETGTSQKTLKKPAS